MQASALFAPLFQMRRKNLNLRGIVFFSEMFSIRVLLHFFSIQDEAVKSDIKQMVKQWEQILRDYKAWHANLDVCFF